MKTVLSTFEKSSWGKQWQVAGPEENRMEVNEGLTCVFRQEAVFVDAKEGVAYPLAR
jgi:hypothetical protein